MKRYPCPYLKGEVEVSDERLNHIRSRHPELPDHLADIIAVTPSDPDEIRSDGRFVGTHLFSRWFDDLLQGKILVVAVVTDDPDTINLTEQRHWIVTVYATRHVTQGEIQWQRP